MRPGDRDVDDAWHAFVRDRFSWTWFVTLTLNAELPSEVALAVVKCWLRRIAVELDAHVPFALGWDTKPNQAAHFHLLLAVPDGVKLGTRMARRLWQSSHASTGHMHMRVYDPTRAGVAYVTNHAHRDMNVACPRHPKCRRRGSNPCVEAPGAW